MARDLSGVLDAVLAGIVVVDTNGLIDLVNSAACRMLEVSEEALAGQPVEQLLGASHPAASLAREVLATGRATVQNELPIERRFADAIDIDLAISPLFDDETVEDAQLSGVVLVMRDRTVQRRLEALAAERERMDAFGQIAAGIAHEVKNPLGGIRGAAEIMGARATDAKTRNAAELVVREVERITNLVDDLMVFARSENMAIAPLNIHRVLDEVLDLIAMDPLGAGVEVKRLFDPSIPELSGDAQRLTQVFLNLARNALQAMRAEEPTRDGAENVLTIVTRMTLDQRLSGPSGEQIPTLVVKVEDTGPGIPPEILGQLGTPFFTTRHGGTGLGLALSRHWVTRHGGTLRIDSAPGRGRGASVQVLLPLRTPEGTR